LSNNFSEACSMVYRFFPPFDKFKVQSAGTGAKPSWRNKGTHSVISGVARVPCTRGAKIFLRPHQQKLQSLKRKIGVKAQKKQKHNICCLLLLFIFRSNKIGLTLRKALRQIYINKWEQQHRGLRWSPQLPDANGFFTFLRFFLKIHIFRHIFDLNFCWKMRFLSVWIKCVDVSLRLAL